MTVLDLFLDTTQPPAITDACLNAVVRGWGHQPIVSVLYFSNSIRLRQRPDTIIEIQGDATFWKESPCPST